MSVVFDKMGSIIFKTNMQLQKCEQPASLAASRIVVLDFSQVIYSCLNSCSESYEKVHVNSNVYVTSILQLYLSRSCGRRMVFSQKPTRPHQTPQ